MMEFDYPVTKTGLELTKILRKALADELNMTEEHIGMCMPKEEHNYSVCVYLYDLKKNSNMQTYKMISISATELKYPSSYYDLYYMIVPYSDCDFKYREEEELKIYDVLLQFLGDVHFLNVDREIQFELCDMDFDSKTKVWAALNQPMRMAVYCKAGPVEIQSTKRKKISRVTDIRMDFIQEEGK